MTKHYFHSNLAHNLAKWHQLSLAEQLAHIGSEISRAIKWKHRDPEYFKLAFYRALELFSFTLADPKNHGTRLKEICRTKELLIDWFFGSQLYHTTDADWERYFHYFTLLANTKYRRNKPQN